MRSFPLQNAQCNLIARLGFGQLVGQIVQRIDFIFSKLDDHVAGKKPSGCRGGIGDGAADQDALLGLLVDSVAVVGDDAEGRASAAGHSHVHAAGGVAGVDVLFAGQIISPLTMRSANCATWAMPSKLILSALSDGR